MASAFVPCAWVPRSASPTSSQRLSFNDSQPRSLPTFHNARTHPRATSTMLAQETSKAKSKSGTSDSGAEYWQGEWICVDCGYTYKPGRKVKFEDLPASWKCPQCNAPKRRFAKKAGDFVAETAATSNTPIVVFSILGLVATLAFGIWAASNL